MSLSCVGYVTDVCVIHRVVEQELIQFIIPSGTKMWILLHDLCQHLLKLVVMYKTKIPRVDVMKGVQREGIKLCEIFL